MRAITQKISMKLVPSDRSAPLEPLWANIIIINQPTNQPTNPPTNQPTNQSINQSRNQAIKQASKQSIHPSIHQASNPSIHQSSNPSIHQSSNQAIHPSSKQSNKQSINQNPSMILAGQGQVLSLVAFRMLRLLDLLLLAARFRSVGQSLSTSRTSTLSLHRTRIFKDF